MRTRDDWISKANAVRTAWFRRLGTTPADHTVIKILCVAQHETACGDAWAGEHNWGACTLRALNAAEHQVLVDASIQPTIDRAATSAAAQAAQAAILAAGLPLPSGTVAGVFVPSAAIHCDSRPSSNRTQIAYFTWFAAFPDDIAGAEYMIAVLIGSPDRPKTAYSVLIDPMRGVYDLAAAMYRQGYYTGFYSGLVIYPDGKTGAEKNVEAYGNALLMLQPTVSAALAPLPSKLYPLIMHGSTDAATDGAVSIWQRAIGTTPVDGLFGLKTLAATRVWQAANGLVPDGMVGGKSWAKAQLLGLVPS